MNETSFARSETPAFRARVVTSGRALTLADLQAWGERFGIMDPAGYLVPRTTMPRHWLEPALKELEEGDRG